MVAAIFNDDVQLMRMNNDVDDDDSHPNKTNQNIIYYRQNYIPPS